MMAKKAKKVDDIKVDASLGLLMLTVGAGRLEDPLGSAKEPELAVELGLELEETTADPTVALC